MSDVSYAAEGMTFENFDPNKQFAHKSIWGVFNGYRFKTYLQRGHALNGMRSHSRAKLYELMPNGWELRAAKNERQKPMRCGNCGGTTMGHRVHSRWNASHRRCERITDPNLVNLGEFVFRRRGRRLVEPIELLFVCEACKRVVDP